MRLQFETMPGHTNGIEIPVLVDTEHAIRQVRPEGIMVDGQPIEIDPFALLDFQYAVNKIETELLPPEHFRDCVHFLFGMAGVWLPTRPLISFDGDLVQEHDLAEQITEHVGRVGFGVPNDERCLGFEDLQFIPVHCALGVETSEGIAYLHKIGTDPMYSISTHGQVLEYYGAEEAYPITKMEYVCTEGQFTLEPSC